MIYLALLAVGSAAGVLAGMFGIGGGIVIVPALLYLFNLDTKTALGTSLAALIPPVGLLGAIQYYRSGYIQVGTAALLATGLFLGAYFGARITIAIPKDYASRIYGGFLFVIGLKMLLSGK